MTTEEMDQTIVTYNDYLDRMAVTVQHFCEDLTDANYQVLSPAIPAIIDGLGWLNEAVESFVKINVLEAEQHTTLQTLIKNLSEAMENKDYILMHDLFEFELQPLLGNLKVTNPEVN
jgi:hypothetical protein